MASSHNDCLFCDTIADHWNQRWELKKAINSLEPPKIHPKNSPMFCHIINVYADDQTYSTLLEMCDSLKNIAFYITSFFVNCEEFLHRWDVKIMKKLKDDIIEIYGLKEKPANVLKMLDLLLEVVPRFCLVELKEKEKGIVFERNKLHENVHNNMEDEPIMPPWCQK
jgi:hypothetical protein